MSSSSHAYYQSSTAMSGSTKSGSAKPEEQIVQVALRNATPHIIELIMAEIEKLNVSGHGQAHEVYLESLNELKDAVAQIRNSSGSMHLARL
ncbi:hypothetical protein BKA59DRAFT_168390 [Fusarium tricinctum]|uniref:Uncharacterized protein n=1 Tax=Fusarium tricinctum TaxID=61284 RepID=A0A8K0S2W6_9HYPO|nr:hypothetical protein BKA59DRAFT_168390 [Fusarium tricinctum]